MNMHRRGFLTGLVLGSGAMMLTRLSRAQSPSPGYYVHIQVNGGADWLLSLDTRAADTPGVHPRLDRQAEARFQNVIPTDLLDADGSPYSVGPAAEPLAGKLARCTILRGIQPNTVSHSVGTYYWLTGRFPAGESPRGSSVTALIAAQRGENGADGQPKLTPHVAFNNQTFNENLPSFASALNVLAPSDFSLLLGAGRYDAYSSEVRAKIRAHLDAERECAGDGTDRRGLVDRYLASRKKAQLVMESGLSAQLDLFNPAAPPEVIEVRERMMAREENPYGAASYLGTAFLAIRSDLVHSVAVGASVTDSHDGYSQSYVHAGEQYAIFDALSRFMDLLEETPGPGGSSLLDLTTIVLSSEFGRTPEINGVGGRDHWPYNSALIVSPNLRTGVYGSTDGNLLPLPIDKDTGRTLPGKSVALEPPNVTATIFAALGLDSLEFRAQPLPFLLR
jgi:hypothetical protein